MPRRSITRRIEEMLGIEYAMPDVKLWVFGIIWSFIALGLVTPIAIAEGTLTGGLATFGFGSLASLGCGGVFFVVQRIYWRAAAPRKGLLLVVAGVSYSLLIWLFAGLYILISRANEKAFYYSVGEVHRGPFDVTTSVYFSVATIATVGYGDIVPVSSLARWLVIGEIAVGAAYTIYIFGALVSLLFSEERERNAPPVPPSGV
jgi:hypothetical protein